MPFSDELHDLLGDPRQAAMLRERAERILERPITLFTEGDVLSAWAPLVSRDLARELLDVLAFVERLSPEEFALIGELALIAEDCYRAWSAELDTDGAEWRQLQWSYTDRRGHRSMLLHIGRWDGEVIRLRTSPEGLGRLIRRLSQAQQEFATKGGAVDEVELRDARELIDAALEAAAEAEDEA